MAQLENKIKKPNDSEDNTIVIKKETIKRLASDVKDIMKDPLIICFPKNDKSGYRHK